MEGCIIPWLADRPKIMKIATAQLDCHAITGVGVFTTRLQALEQCNWREKEAR